jgi:cytosine/adenosine deaminase-related metal-dependent hydrolase
MAEATIIANGIVVTCDATNRCGRYNMLVRNGRIGGITENLDNLKKENPDAAIIDASRRFITPGFVNAHYHGESFLLHTLTNGIHFSSWKDDDLLKQATDKFLHQSGHDDVRSLYRASFLAHVKSGTTCVGAFPLHFDEDALLQMLEGIASVGITSIVALQNWDQIGKMKSLHDGEPRQGG